ncbi:MAG: hypothetical protein QGI11_15710, partial [Nitrospinota bacterium]|nr:hypothetical protein [Nitrospinota bacterium]
FFVYLEFDGFSFKQVSQKGEGFFPPQRTARRRGHTDQGSSHSGAQLEAVAVKNTGDFGG